MGNQHRASPNIPALSSACVKGRLFNRGDLEGSTCAGLRLSERAPASKQICGPEKSTRRGLHNDLQAVRRCRYQESGKPSRILLTSLASGYILAAAKLRSQNRAGSDSDDK